MNEPSYGDVIDVNDDTSTHRLVLLGDTRTYYENDSRDDEIVLVHAT